MRIAQIAPLYERIPPMLYGGTERVIHALTEELVRRGHDVTLFASADSVTNARLVPMVPTGARLGGATDTNALHVAMLAEVYSQAGQFDILHAHVDVLTFPFARYCQIPTVHTMHGRLDLPEQQRALRQFGEQHLVSISANQRNPVRGQRINWTGTVHNGINLENFTFRHEPERPPYLMFLGRISPEKGPVKAIEIARRAGVPLKIAAKIDPADKAWAEENFLPLVDTPGIQFLGEVDEARKAELLAGALALLFPIDWPEPFGMVLIEALACGTPVIALPGGSVEEILIDGRTGFICRSIDEMVASVARIEEIDRAACREHVEKHFSARIMADGYEAIYAQVVNEAALAKTRVIDAFARQRDILIDAQISDGFHPDSLVP